ncbi:MAG: sulfate adenylyltransferase subunit CysD [Pseudomonadota bacterium]
MATLHASLESGQSKRTLERDLKSFGLLPEPLPLDALTDDTGLAPRMLVVRALDAEARRKRWQSLVLQEHRAPDDRLVLFANDARSSRRWVFLPASANDETLLTAIDALTGGKNAIVWPQGVLAERFRALVATAGSHDLTTPAGHKLRIGTVAFHTEIAPPISAGPAPAARSGLTHLDRLEAESIYIIREVVAQAENPVMLYSLGKDSSVMLHLARKAFHPSPPPFPLMHIDTRWKFKAMYRFRDQIASEAGMDLIVHINPEGVEKDINPFDHGSAVHTDIMKTEGLKQALDKYGFDVAFGGARRDEEKSRAKERVFSFRTKAHRWDPKNQRPELWSLYNGYKTAGESVRVFPLSNWTELDIWQYLYREQIPIVPLYFAQERPVVERDGMLIMVDDDRMRLLPGEEIRLERVRFRTLGCYPLTGAVESNADDLASIVLELLESRTSERQGRAIDNDTTASMEKKKQEGYF